MKKLFIALLTAVLATGAFAQDTAFPDIPENHWAGDAVSRIADLGIVIGFPDGTFRGNEAFTRYQAALVVSRMLDVLQSNIDAAQAMTDEDIASLRNAVQELASDVAAQGVRLSAAESAIASVSDDVVANAARLDAIEAAAGDGDGAALSDLQNQIASQRVAIDTAQAQAEAAEALAGDALDVANAAAARARQNADELSALNAVIQNLSDRVDALGLGTGEETNLQPVLDRITRNENDIANIREFVILLRRDQVALRDRVAALESSDAEQAEAIADLQGRVTDLETNPLGISGTITVEYRVERLTGAGEAFDIDRAYGVGMDRDIGNSYFSSGEDDVDEDDDIEEGEYAQDRADITGDDTPVSADVEVELGTGFQFDGDGDPNALNTFSVVAKFNLREVDLTDTDGEDFTGYVFALDEFTGTFDPIGSEPLTFAFGEEIGVSYTPYTVWFEDEPGFVATVGAPDFLAFLDPTLSIVYSPRDLTGDFDDDGEAIGEGEIETVLRGIRATVAPIDGVTVGGTFAQRATGTEDKDDAAGDNVTTTVFGVDGTAAISIFDLSFEYASSSTSDAALADVADANPTDSDAILFVELGVDGEALPVLDELSFNYRDITADWTAFGDDDEYPYEVDQAGFGVNAGLALFILDVDAYFDRYETGDPHAWTTAYGVDVTADLFAGFDLTGYFKNVTIDGEQADDNDATERDDEYITGFGVGLEHDGEAEDALIANLDLEFAFEMNEAGYDETRIYAAADYTLAVSILELTPYVSYESIVDSDEASDDTSEIKVGTGLQTEELGVFFAPSLEAAVNYRTAAHSDVVGDESVDADTYTATELQWAVGLNLNEFLFDHSTLALRYGSYSGTNVSTADPELLDEDDVGVGIDGASDVSRGDAPNGVTQFVNGYEIVWSYYDLSLGYGVYTSDEGTGAGETSGQVFSIDYVVTF